MSRADACVFVTSSAWLIVWSRTTTTPCPRSAGEVAHRTASRRLSGPSSLASEAARMAPVTTTGASPSRSRSQKKAVSSITSVPWTTTTPSKDGSAWQRRISLPISNSCSNEKWLAGVRPRSTISRSAIRSIPGARARIAAPSSVGTFPPASALATIEIVPPVKMTATLAIRCLGRLPASGRAAGDRRRRRRRGREGGEAGAGRSSWSGRTAIRARSPGSGRALRPGESGPG